MEKTCFIIMPISDCDPYPIGHFKRVYEHIIRPAVLNAGFYPLRADDILNTNYIAIDIVKRIIESDMAVCDLSSRNPNVLYELGIRQSFNLPVTLIRDSLTHRIFDIQGFRDIEYDETLRIDNVEYTIETLSATIKNTYQTRNDEINSLVSLLSIHPAKKSKDFEISKETEILLEVFKGLDAKISSLEQKLIMNENLTPAFQIPQDIQWNEMSSTDYNQLKVGDIVAHKTFGIGKVTALKGSAHNPVAEILFQHTGTKLLMLNYARLMKCNDQAAS